ELVFFRVNVRICALAFSQTGLRGMQCDLTLPEGALIAVGFRFEFTSSFISISGRHRKMRLIESVHGGYVHKRRVWILSDRFSRLIPSNSRVLDVGCGDGRPSVAC